MSVTLWSNEVSGQTDSLVRYARWSKRLAGQTNSLVKHQSLTSTSSLEVSEVVAARATLPLRVKSQSGRLQPEIKDTEAHLCRRGAWGCAGFAHATSRGVSGALSEDWRQRAVAERSLIRDARELLLSGDRALRHHDASSNQAARRHGRR
eukprot:243159-Rhodomonas_salina.1